MFGWNPAGSKASPKVFNLHISEITSRFNDDQIFNQRDTFCQNAETEKLQYYEDEESFEFCEASENFENSKGRNNMLNFDKINKLGEKRRSKSINNCHNSKDKSYVSEDYHIDNSNNKWSIGAMPEGFSLSKGAMPKLHEWSNIMKKFSEKVRILI